MFPQDPISGAPSAASPLLAHLNPEQLAAVIDPTGQKVPQGGMEQGAHEFEKALAAAKSGH